MNLNRFWQSIQIKILTLVFPWNVKIQLNQLPMMALEIKDAAFGVC